MVQRRLRVVKWLNTTPAIGVCALCSREFRVPISALKRTADAQASLQEQFDRHTCGPENAGALLRQEPDDEEDEEEEDNERKDEDDDDDNDMNDDGYSE